ncbi:hypothetical protein [Pedobacter psychroterrae]|uniref:hypothetical protein n=1 Tax=Pedobacter psychroterrae TaxID=2530453 RepID=UPI0013F15381|nr:hypothetical protein [Pedobacter psychroterrae]
MTSTSKFILKLSFLIVPFSFLSLILHDGGKSGGYDLSGLVSGSLLFAVIAAWLIWMLIGYSISSNHVNCQHNHQP